MSKQPEALRLADALTTQPDCNCHASSYFECACDAIWPEQWIDSAAAELRRIQAQMTACEPYLKEGETPAERIERDHRDSLALMTLLAREKTKNEALLAVLKELQESASYWSEYDVPLGIVNRINTAIAKAEATT